MRTYASKELVGSVTEHEMYWGRARMRERELSPFLECAFCTVVGVEYIRLLHHHALRGLTPYWIQTAKSFDRSTLIASD